MNPNLMIVTVELNNYTILIMYKYFNGLVADKA